MNIIGRNLWALLVIGSTALGGCSEKKEVDCVGEAACLGEWKGFRGALGEGSPCTTPADDLHIRYDGKSSDELVALWSPLIPATLGLRLKDEWGVSGEYRQAWYVSDDGARTLNVSIVQSGSTRVRTVRLTWE